MEHHTSTETLIRHEGVRRVTGLAVVGLLVAAAAAPLAAQTRQSLVADALIEFDQGRQRQLLRDALNPALGAPDSAFAVAVQMLAQNHLESGQVAQAELWLKWAIRQAPDMEPDPLQFPANVLSAFDAAREAVRGEGGAGVGSGVWRWPAGEVGQGVLRVVPSVPADPLIVVQGVGSVDPGRDLPLDPGTYRAQVSAEGYATAVVWLEILPGVTAEMAFSLSTLGDSLMSDAVEASALSALVRIRAVRAGETSCGAGVLVGQGGLVLTTYTAIRGAERVTAQVGGVDASGDVSVAAYDAALNVAVLRVPLTSSDSLPVTERAVEDAWGWGLTFPECGAGSAARTRLGFGGPGGRTVALESEMANGDQGGPIIDNTGTIIAVSLGNATVLPAASTRAVIDQGRNSAASGSVVAVRDVSRLERHLYGRVEVRSEAQGASARITPLESWHWSGLTQTASLPFLFAGPMGRYQVELLVDGEVRRRTEVVIQPEQVTQLAVNAGGGGGMGLVLGLVGIGAAGAGACVLFLCGGDDGGGTPPPSNDTGEITFVFPNPAIRSTVRNP